MVSAIRRIWEKPGGVVGGGPAGLECARALGDRRYTVVLVEARKDLLKKLWYS